MPERYFSEREHGEEPPVRDSIDQRVWDGIRAEIERRLANGSFAKAFPEVCPDGGAIVGTDQRSFFRALRGRFPNVVCEYSLILRHDVTGANSIFDAIEFCYEHVAEPTRAGYHEFFRHEHLSFDTTAETRARECFRNNINAIFRLNGLAYELAGDGSVRRLQPPVLGATLQSVVFRTGDAELDRLLETARTKYADPRTEVRREALEKLWDAWERLKTLHSPGDKREGVTNQLDRAAGERAPMLRKFLESDAKDLTALGNQLMIRHTETGKEPIEAAEHIDYLFHRLFNVIWLILRRRG